MIEARRLDEQLKLQEDEFSQLERQVEQKRHRLQSLEAKEAQLRAEVNSLTWRKPELEGLLMKGIFSPLLLLPPLPADLVWRQWKCFQADYMEDSIEDSATVSIR